MEMQPDSLHAGLSPLVCPWEETKAGIVRAGELF